MALTSGVDYRIVGVAIVVVRCHPHPAKHVLKEIKVKIFTEMQKKTYLCIPFFRRDWKPRLVIISARWMLRFHPRGLEQLTSLT